MQPELLIGLLIRDLRARRATITAPPHLVSPDLAQLVYDAFLTGYDEAVATLQRFAPGSAIDDTTALPVPPLVRASRLVEVIQDVRRRIRERRTSTSEGAVASLTVDDLLIEIAARLGVNLTETAPVQPWLLARFVEGHDRADLRLLWNSDQMACTACGRILGTDSTVALYQNHNDHSVLALLCTECDLRQRAERKETP